jgi:5-hydroxyisourate hydrolase
VSAITTHVLDTALGRPAEGIPVVLEQKDEYGQWNAVGHGVTDADGRLRTLMRSVDALVPGTYRLLFETAGYFESRNVRAFYPSIVVTFSVLEAGAHYHVPLLLSPFGYTTYRGS